MILCQAKLKMGRIIKRNSFLKIQPKSYRFMSTIKCKNNFGKIVEVPKDKFFFRPSAYGIIIHKNKIVTLTNKSNGKFWFPGGGVEVGEKIEDGLRREITEETGLDVIVKKLIFSKENFFYYQPLDEAYHAFLFFYLCEPLTRKLILDDQVNDLESKKPRWTAINRIKKEDLSDLNGDLFFIINNLTIRKTAPSGNESN